MNLNKNTQSANQLDFLPLIRPVSIAHLAAVIGVTCDKIKFRVNRFSTLTDELDDATVRKISAEFDQVPYFITPKCGTHAAFPS